MSRAAIRAMIAAGVLLGSGCASSCKHGAREDKGESQGVQLTPVESVDQAGLTALIWPADVPQAHVPLTEAELDALGRAVGGLVSIRDFEHPSLPAVAGSASKAGFELRRLKVADRPLIALLDERARGAGAYLWWLDASATDHVVILQAPHSFFDTHTGKLALGGFLASQPPPAALFVNTLHRYVGTDGKRTERARGENPSDPAHNPSHAFSAATSAAAKSFAPRKVTFIQLHGFGAEPESTPDGGSIIVSAGRKQGSTPSSTAVANALNALGLGRVVRYPEQAQRLGATTNVQRQALETVPNADFVHIEMSREVRRQLDDDPGRLLAFTRAIVAAATQEPR